MAIIWVPYNLTVSRIWVDDLVLGFRTIGNSLLELGTGLAKWVVPVSHLSKVNTRLLDAVRQVVGSPLRLPTYLGFCFERQTHVGDTCHTCAEIHQYNATGWNSLQATSFAIYLAYGFSPSWFQGALCNVIILVCLVCRCTRCLTV